MSTKQTEALKLAQELRALADRFSEGWHDGIKIDALDIELLAMAASAIEQPAQQKTLTREQRDAAISVANRMLEHGAPMSWEEALIDAIEAAHNIGEKK